MTRKPLAALIALLLLPLTPLQAAEVVAQPEIITVQSGESGGQMVLGGTVIPYKRVTLSAQMPGDVKLINGSEGSFVKRGDPLVQLDTGALLAKRTQALTQLSSAQAGYQNAITQYNRELISPNGQSNSMMGGLPGMASLFTDPMRSMGGQGSPGFDRHANIVGQSTQVQTAINQINQAKAAIAELDESLENAIARAPFDGTVITKMVEVGDIVQPGMPLVTFADLTQMQIQVQVPSRLIHRLSNSAKIQARLDHNEQRLVDLQVAQIFPSAQEGGHTTTVKFNLPAGLPVQSGTYAEVVLNDLSAPSRDLPLVPTSAIIWRGSLPAVFKIEGEYLQMQILRTGAQSADGRVAVISGLQVGDRVLNHPTPSTRSGPIAHLTTPPVMKQP